MKITKIGFVFENCESILLSTETITDIMTSQIKDSIMSSTMYSRVDNFSCIIRGDHEQVEEINFFDEGVFLTERLKVCDVTHLEFEFENLSRKIVSVMWQGDSQYHSSAQKLTCTDQGNYVFSSIIDEDFHPFTTEGADMRVNLKRK